MKRDFLLHEIFILIGALENDIEINDFINAVQKESFIEGFVSDLSIMKGRDIEETYSNFDNDNKSLLIFYIIYTSVRSPIIKCNNFCRRSIRS